MCRRASSPKQGLPSSYEGIRDPFRARLRGWGWDPKYLDYMFAKVDFAKYEQYLIDSSRVGFIHSRSEAVQRVALARRWVRMLERSLDGRCRGHELSFLPDWRDAVVSVLARYLPSFPELLRHVPPSAVPFRGQVLGSPVVGLANAPRVTLHNWLRIPEQLVFDADTPMRAFLLAWHGSETLVLVMLDACA